MRKKGVEILKLRIDLKIIVVILIFLFTGQLKTYCIIMFFCFLHEFGHIITAKLFKMQIEKIEILPCGFSASFFSYNLSGVPKVFSMQELLVALAGPIVSLILALSFQYIDDTNFTILTKQEIVYSNILILIFNLLPLYPLDGGRIVKSLIYLFLGKKKAEKYTNNISFIFLIIVTFMGSVATFYFENMAIFLIIICLWLIYIKEDITYKKKIKIYDLIEKTIENNVD